MKQRPLPKRSSLKTEMHLAKDTSVSAWKEDSSSLWNKVGVGGFDPTVGKRRSKAPLTVGHRLSPPGLRPPVKGIGLRQ